MCFTLGNQLFVKKLQYIRIKTKVVPLAVENLTTKPEGQNSFVFSKLEIPFVLAFLFKNLTYFMLIWEATLILVVWILRFFSKVDYKVRSQVMY